MNEKIKKIITKLSEPKIFKKIVNGTGIILAAFIIFSVGMFVGFHKGSFRGDLNDNFSKNFGPRRNNHINMMRGLPENFPNASGAVGKIIKIELPTIIVEDKENIEKVVLIKDDTQIRQMREGGTKDDLKIDSFVVVIGSPNLEGQIEAKLIRILPSPVINTNEVKQ